MPCCSGPRSRGPREIRRRHRGLAEEPTLANHLAFVLDSWCFCFPPDYVSCGMCYCAFASCNAGCTALGHPPSMRSSPRRISTTWACRRVHGNDSGVATISFRLCGKTGWAMFWAQSRQAKLFGCFLSQTTPVKVDNPPRTNKWIQSPNVSFCGTFHWFSLFPCQDEVANRHYIL